MLKSQKVIPERIQSVLSKSPIREQEDFEMSDFEIRLERMVNRVQEF